MAARLKPKHSEDVKAKIQGSQLVNMLQAVALEGEFHGEKVGTERLRAAEVLLRKILPDMKATEHSGEVVTKWGLKL